MSGFRENEIMEIDLRNVLRDVFRGLRKFWWLIIGLTLILALKEYFAVSITYQPQYIASATMAVRCVGNDWDYVNEETAKQMANVFPYILESGILQEEIEADMGLEYMPGSISMSAEEGTNLFTVSANAGEPELSYELLQATLRQYPEVARFVIGEIEMEILDETGIPKDSGKERVIRGSFVDGAVQGAIIGLMIVGIYVVTRNTVKTRKDLKKIINLEDYGSIPLVAMKKRKTKKENTAVNLNSARVSIDYMEAVRKLCIKVMKEMEVNNDHSLLITSSIPGEGKTTLAVNLGIALARLGKKVLLIDCDLRNPSVARNMNEKNIHPGLVAVLRNKISVKHAITEVEVKGGKIDILYGGKPNTEATHLLGTEGMGKLIKMLENLYDVVILDTAPAELLADATALAKYVDAALYVVKCDYAKKSRIRNGVRALGDSGIKILGYVFNADNGKRNSKYGYGYKRYYGYGNRKKDEMSGRVIID